MCVHVCVFDGNHEKDLTTKIQDDDEELFVDDKWGAPDQSTVQTVGQRVYAMYRNPSADTKDRPVRRTRNICESSINQSDGRSSMLCLDKLILYAQKSNFTSK